MSAISLRQASERYGVPEPLLKNWARTGRLNQLNGLTRDGRIDPVKLETKLKLRPVPPSQRLLSLIQFCDEINIPLEALLKAIDNGHFTEREGLVGELPYVSMSGYLKEFGRRKPARRQSKPQRNRRRAGR